MVKRLIVMAATVAAALFVQAASAAPPGSSHVYGSGGQRLRVIDVVPFEEDDESPFVGLLQVEALSTRQKNPTYRPGAGLYDSIVLPAWATVALGLGTTAIGAARVSSVPSSAPAQARQQLARPSHAQGERTPRSASFGLRNWRTTGIAMRRSTALILLSFVALRLTSPLTVHSHWPKRQARPAMRYRVNWDPSSSTSVPTPP